MAYTREQIQKMFQSQFNLTKWTDCIINFFKSREVKRHPVPLDIDPEEGEGYELAYLDTSDTYRISFFYLKLNRSIDQRKVGLRQLIDKYIKIDSDAGIGVFDDGNHWRLSFITDLRGVKTSPKRYTFVFGDSQNMYRTAVDRFMELQRKGITFANIKEAFSVEALTKQFYNDLFEWYTWALDPETGVYFPNNPNTPDDDREYLDTKMIRLITRLMFVWFIKQKGLVPDALFNPDEVNLWLKDFNAQSMDSANYYQAILQNLFFATLNRPIKTITTDKDGNEIVEPRKFAESSSQDVKSLYRHADLFKISKDKILSIFEFIPFINGGLFECLDKNKTSDGVDYAYYEDGFSRNSTIKDGRWTRRAFIPNKLFFDPEDGIISIFNRYNFTVEENSPSEQQVALDPELLGKVFENLLGVYNPETKDTARKQSGSFYTPREIVNYMVDISLQAYLGNTDDVKAVFAEDFEYVENQKPLYDTIITKLKAIKVLDPACGSGAFPMGMLNRIVDILQRLKAPGTQYNLKLDIMENCIYGGDIQTIAAQITKLRFFISLVCDCQKTDNPDENYGIPNLPNLETHFVTCDSLIGLKKPQSYSLFEQDVLALKEKLKEVRHEHFTAKSFSQKRRLRDRDKQLREELAKMLASDNVIASEDAKQMAAWNPYDQNAKSPFFDPEWMFGIKDGFDVVIGNPPYVSVKAISSNMKKIYSDIFETGKGRFNLFTLFIERGYKLLCDKGVMSMIVPEGIYSNIEYRYSRQLIVEDSVIKKLCIFSRRVFEASVDTTVFLISRNRDNGKSKFPIDLDLRNTPISFCQSDIKKFPYYIIPSKLNIKDKDLIERLILSPKYSNMGDVLETQQGIIYTGQAKEDVFADYIKNSTYKPILDGRDVVKWRINWDIKEYDKYLSYTNKLHRPREERLFLADKKILFPRRATSIVATIDTKQYYALNTAYISLLKSSEYSIEYILALLNSKLIDYIYSKLFMGWQITIPAIEIMPVAKIGKDNNKKLEEYVNTLLKLKEKDLNYDTNDLERKIDYLIYTIYDLSPEEIAIVDKSK